MSKLPRRSTVLGTYAPDRFMITLGRKFQLVDASDLKRKHLDDDQLSVLFHEYVHYLQNIATPAGYHSFRRALDMWSLFRETVGAGGVSGGSRVLSPERREWMSQYLAIADAFDGQNEPDLPADFEPKLFDIDKIVVTPKELPLGSATSLISEVVLEGTAIESAFAKEPFTYRFGAIAIMEGIAYELDQIVAAGADGAAIPSYPSPPFPYQVLRKFCTRECPGIETRVVIRLACLSLQSNDPAGALVDLCRNYLSGVAGGGSADEAIEKIQQGAGEILALTDAILAKDIPEHEEVFRNAGNLGRAVNHVHALFRKFIELRKSEPFIELTVVSASGKLDHSRMSELYARIPPCTILQEGRGPKKKMGRDTLLCLSDDVAFAARDDMAVLHCAQHFLLSHLDADRIRPTNDIGPSTCPFYTCCSLPMRQTDAAICKKRPWKAATWAGWPAGQTCWYGAAARASTNK